VPSVLADEPALFVSFPVEGLPVVVRTRFRLRLVRLLGLTFLLSGFPSLVAFLLLSGTLFFLLTALVSPLVALSVPAAVVLSLAYAPVLLSLLWSLLPLLAALSSLPILLSVTALLHLLSGPTLL